MKYVICYIVGVLILLLTSCYKDLGNYDYHEINEVQFAGFPTEKMFKFRGVDSIKVYPDISGTLNDKDLSQYTFKWEAVVKSGTTAEGKTHYPLDSNRVNLEYFVKLPEAEYAVYLLVKDKETNVTWRQSFDLKVTTALNEGWMILSEVNNTCRLDMISLSGGKEMIVKDVWEGTEFASWKGPKQLAIWVDMFAAAGENPVYLVAKDGAVKLDPKDLGYDELNNVEYEFAQTPSNMEPLRMAGNYVNAWRICVTDKGVFAKDDMMTGSLYGMPINRLDGESEYFGVAPAIGMTAYPYDYNPAVILYDTTNLRFVQINTNLASMRLPTAQETVFPFQTGKDFVYMTSTLHDTYGILFTILKENTGKLHLYGIKFKGGQNIEQAKDYCYPLDAPEIEKATCFAVHPILYYLFYAVDNKIYQYDLITKDTRILPISFEDEVKESLPEHDITMLKFNIFILGGDNKPEGAEMQYRLIVGSKGTEELDGIVRMLEIPTLMDKPAVVRKEYGGFGRVVDVTYRERQ